jgi:hypothetical protein
VARIGFRALQVVFVGVGADEKKGLGRRPQRAAKVERWSAASTSDQDSLGGRHGKSVPRSLRSDNASGLGGWKKPATA